MSSDPLPLRDLLRFLPPTEGLESLRASLAASSVPDPALRWTRAGRYVTLDSRKVDGDGAREALARWRREEEERVRATCDQAGEILRALLQGDRPGAADLLLAMGLGELEAGRPAGAVRILERAAEVAASLPDRRLECRAVRLLAKSLWRSGRLERAMTAYRRASLMARETGDRAEEARSLQGLGNVCAAEGRWPEAWRHHLEALRRSAGDEPEFLLLRGQTYNNLSQVGRRMGRLAEAWGYQRRATHVWESVNAPVDRLVHLNNEGLLHLAEGEAAKAADVFRAALAEAGSPLARAVLLTNLAQAALRQGDPDHAAELAREAEEHSLEAGAEDTLIEVYVILGSSLRDRGDDQGITFFEKALELARSTPFALLEARVHLEYGRLRSEFGDPEEGRAHFREALRIAEELGSAPEIAEARRELG